MGQAEEVGLLEGEASRPALQGAPADGGLEEAGPRLLEAQDHHGLVRLLPGGEGDAGRLGEESRGHEAGDGLPELLDVQEASRLGKLPQDDLVPGAVASLPLQAVPPILSSTTSRR